MNSQAISPRITDLVLYIWSFASFLLRAFPQVVKAVLCELALNWVIFGMIPLLSPLVSSRAYRVNSNVILSLLFFFIVPPIPLPHFSLFIHTCKIISKVIFWKQKHKNLKNDFSVFRCSSFLILQSTRNTLFSTFWQNYLIYSHPVSPATLLKSHFHSAILTSWTVSWRIWLSWYIYLKKNNQAQNTIFSDYKTIAHNADSFSHKLGTKADNIHTS